ncbi:alpha/beta hydrolase [Dyadobacter sp. NIV53]|uniref:alpha/beta hydrolase n=1 Tax=Dyadobacter sp. NIV53 TaxID=2861765 RepID=UPI001C8727BE|nr:alpha/beta hydrolase [Dyadobacter sp. NIV53]
MENKNSISKTSEFFVSNLYGGFATQQELDAEYDVEKAVPDFLEYIHYFTKSSETARGLLESRTVVSYGETLMERLTVYPAKNPDAPVMLFVHGGYWRLGIGDEYDFVALGPSQAGFTVVNITYALTPVVNIPEMVRQVRSAIAWTAKNISNFNGNPDSIFVAGHSAGAHLSAMAITTDWSAYGLPADTIKGVLAVSGLYDLEPVSQTFVQPSVCITAEQILSSSPILLIGQSNVPLTVVWGALETAAFQEQSYNYLKAWQHAGNQADSLVVSNANHFNILKGFETADGFLTREVLSLLENSKSISTF